MGSPPLPASVIAQAMHLHPRVAYQGLFSTEAQRTALAERLPPLIPFREPYRGAVAVLDWDHRLPSRKVALRLFLFHDDATLAAGVEAFDDRLEEIGLRDRFPEFDVPDFSDLPADEAYEAEIEPDGTVTSCRLTSAWRREVDEEDGELAIRLVRASREFAKVVEGSPTSRPHSLGDLEAVSWTPPCESGHARWTVDVWYLLSFDGRLGSGRSLLVDLEERKVVVSREFAVRTA